MLAAFTVSSIFLASHSLLSFQRRVSPLQKEGSIRTVYFAILLSHTILAAFVGVMAPSQCSALSANASPPTVARITFPLWAYVSITGVLVYFMLYQL
jgi:uncharacterized membrane protein YozB (DUF420 family)